MGGWTEWVLKSDEGGEGEISLSDTIYYSGGGGGGGKAKVYGYKTYSIFGL